MVDASDRDSANYPSPFNFIIQRPNSILNGFFNRIGTTEVVLEWDWPTIQSTNYNGGSGNNTLIFDISGYGANPITYSMGSQYAITAADVLNGFVSYVNDLSGTTNFFLSVIYFVTPPAASPTWTLIGRSTAGGNAALPFAFRYTTLSKQFNFSGSTQVPPPQINFTAYYQLFNADLRPYRFIDFVSRTLTYNQDLKDASTNKTVVDVLCRWYMSYDSEMKYDAYDLPIHMGYSPFSLRRLFNPPKQIRWDMIQPVGQMSFEVWGELYPQDNNAVYPYQQISGTKYNKTNYYLTLQVSEN